MLGTRTAAMWARRYAAAACAMTLAGPVAAQSPGVGEAFADPASLGPVFASVCLDSTSLSEAQGRLRAMGMLDNPETGTFFHQTFDLSINPADGVCSIVFAINGPAQAGMDAYSRQLAIAGGARSSEVQVSSFENSGETYLRSGIEVQW